MVFFCCGHPCCGCLTYSSLCCGHLYFGRLFCGCPRCGIYTKLLKYSHQSIVFNPKHLKNRLHSKPEPPIFLKTAILLNLKF